MGSQVTGAPANGGKLIVDTRFDVVGRPTCLILKEPDGPDGFFVAEIKPVLGTGGHADPIAGAHFDAEDVSLILAHPAAVRGRATWAADRWSAANFS